MRLRTVSVVFWLTLFLWAFGFYLAVFAQPPAEGAMGTYPVPEIVGMTGASFVISGVAGAKLTYADHELSDGTFWVGEIAVTFKHRGHTGLMRIPELRGQTVRLLIQVVEPRALQEIRK